MVRGPLMIHCVKLAENPPVDIQLVPTVQIIIMENNPGKTEWALHRLKTQIPAHLVTFQSKSVAERATGHEPRPGPEKVE